MTTRPSQELRRRVIERAGNRCEYCLIHQNDAVASHQLDHVIAERHQGLTDFGNLALSCMLCNVRKGSDLASIDPDTGAITPLYNPRTQQWSDHFGIEGPRLIGMTSTGRATLTLLQLNSHERIAERRELVKAGRFPPSR